MENEYFHGAESDSIAPYHPACCVCPFIESGLDFSSSGSKYMAGLFEGSSASWLSPCFWLIPLKYFGGTCESYLIKRLYFIATALFYLL